MSTVTTTPLPSEMTPLSPDQFTDSGAAADATMTTGGTATTEASLTASDRATLQVARELLTAARANLASANRNMKESARKQIGVVSTYLIGFCDGRGLIEEAPVKPGFETVFGPDVQPDLDTALDELDAILEQTLAAADTRSWREVAHAIGDACIAVGAALIGG